MDDASNESRWLICEKRPKWVAEIRCRLVVEGPRLFETRTLSSCWAELQQSPASVVVWELDAVQLERLVETIGRQCRWFPDSLPLAVAPRRDASCQWLLREAGAKHVVTSPRDVPQLVELARKHLARHQPAGAWHHLPLIDRRPWTPRGV